jgi:hypothetical protein
MSQTIETEEPFLINPWGNRVPEKFINGRLLLEHQTVLTLIQKAQRMRVAMEVCKAEAFADVTAFQDALSANYNVTRKGSRGGVTLTSFDGLMKIEKSTADTMTFGPELEVAKDLIDQCIAEWVKDANDNLRVLVNDAFRVGATGKISVDRVIGLRRLEIPDDRWRQAMNIISDALRAQSSRTYIRFYTRENLDAKWVQIVLDMSSL